MVRSYIFSGLKRRQFSLLFLFSLLFAFMIAAGALSLLINKLIFELGFNGHKDAWLMPVILGTTFVVSILVASILIRIVSRVIKKTWNISFNFFEISIDETGQDKKHFLVSQLQQVTFFKTKAMMGFNQAIQLKFGDEMVDIQIVISPILASSTSTDKEQFLAFIEFLFEKILVEQFEQRSKSNILSEVASLLANENLIEYKYIFERKETIF